MKKKILLASLAVTLPLLGEMKIVAFSGSTRSESYNKKLIAEAAEIARKAGAKVTLIDLKDFPMPLYDADLEQKEGLPKNAKKLRDLMIASDAIMISSPEYNASISAVLKNAIDWTSRNENGEGSYEAYKGKKFALMSASPGRRGGARALIHLRTIIEALGGEVLQKQVSVPLAYEAFDAKGHLLDIHLRKSLEEEVQELIPVKAESKEKVSSAR